MADPKNEPVFTYEQSAFAGGVSCIPDPRLIEQTQYALGWNCYPTRSGRIRRRPMLAPLNSSTWGAHPARAIRTYIPEGGSAEMVFVWFDDTMAMVVDGAVTTLLTGLDTTGVIANEEWAGGVYFSDGVNGLYRTAYYGTDTTASQSYLMAAINANMYATAKAAGSVGNNVSITFADPGGTTASLSVVATGTGIVVNLARANSALTTTAALAKAAIEANTDANALVSMDMDGGGSGILNAVLKLELTGGYDAGTLDVSLQTSSYSFSYLAKRSSSERLFGIDALDRTTVRWCNAFDPTTWNAVSAGSPGGVLVAMGEVGQSFIIATDELLYRIDGTDPTTWQVMPVPSDGLGCRAADTFTVVEGAAVYWSSRGVAVYDGTRPQPLSDLVFDPNDLTRGAFPTNPATYGAMFSLTTGDHLFICYSSDDDATRCNSAMVYDFRMKAWGGPYIYDEPLYCGMASLRDPDGSVPRFGSEGFIMRETSVDAAADAEGPVAPAMLVKFIAIDGARPLMDKVFAECRVGVNALEPCDVTVWFVVDGEAVAERVYSVPAGESVIRKRVEGARGKTGNVVVETLGQCEIFAVGADCFFVQAR